MYSIVRRFTRPLVRQKYNRSDSSALSTCLPSDLPVTQRYNQEYYNALLSQGGPTLLNDNDMVGFGLNGVPFKLAPHPSKEEWIHGASEQMDGCLGSVDGTSGAYFYYLPSPCMFNLNQKFK
jgi:hypothetical protein